eukprot:9457741-Ditylum_brightwellii.AAC.1
MDGRGQRRGARRERVKCQGVRVTVYWCGQCADFKLDHGTNRLRKKCPHYKPNSKSNKECPAAIVARRATAAAAHITTKSGMPTNADTALGSRPA